VSDLPTVNVPTVPAMPLIMDPQAGGSGFNPTSTTDDVHLVVERKTISGWQRVQITRGIEIMPSSFDLMLTERYPGEADQIDVKAGDFCIVMIGSTLVMTGYIDRRVASIGPQGNVVQITGRSRCCDLVDCSIDPDQLPNMQISQGTALSVATLLAAQYGIDVQQLGTPNAQILPQLNLNLGETPYTWIEQVCRYTAQLCYDEVDGSLNISSVNVGAMASGFAEGWNIEAAQGMQAMDQRYSDIDVFLTATQTLREAGPLPPLVSVQDQTVSRFRKLIIISEQATLGANFAQQRGNWELARRYGRSQACSLVCDSWRDKAGTLWHVNCTAPLDVPHLKLTAKTWLISQITFRRDEGGTHADVVLMPPEAFVPEPILLFPFDAQTALTLQQGGGAANPGPTP
jgi:prophage tail gpP-like protein